MKKLRSYILLLVVFLSTLLAPVANAQVTEDLLGYGILAESQNVHDLITVEDYKVIDGDTADFILDRNQDSSIKARFLLIDAPETRGNIPYAQEAKERVQELFDKAHLIQVEYEGAKKDAYQRDLVHVWVDGILLQEILVSEGLAIARYIDDYIPDSVYADTIFESQDYAQRNAFNVWFDGDSKYLSNAESPSNAVVVTPTPPSTIEEYEAPSSEPTERMVYIAPYSGTKYHYSANCRGLRNANSIAELTLTEAQAQGYTLCGYED